MTLDDYFDGWQESRLIFDALQRAVEAAGTSLMQVTKSQVAFRRRRTFAWAWIPGRYLRGTRAPLVLTIALPYRDRSTRWKEVVEPRPGQFTHHLELFSAGAIDAQIVGWLREAWRHADGPASGRPRA
jgi:hypothetical protein